MIIFVVLKQIIEAAVHVSLGHQLCAEVVDRKDAVVQLLGACYC